MKEISQMLDSFNNGSGNIMSFIQLIFLQCFFVVVLLLAPSKWAVSAVAKEQWNSVLGTRVKESGMFILQFVWQSFSKRYLMSLKPELRIIHKLVSLYWSQQMWWLTKISSWLKQGEKIGQVNETGLHWPWGSWQFFQKKLLIFKVEI